jgi:hypothetical protein
MRILHTHFIDPDCRLMFWQGSQRLARLDTAMLWGFPFFLLWQPDTCLNHPFMELEQTLHPIRHWSFVYNEPSLRLSVEDEPYHHSISLASIWSPSISLLSLIHR